MPEEEQRPGPRSEQTTVLSAPQPVEQPTAEDGTPANGLDPHTQQLTARPDLDSRTRPMTPSAEQASAEAAVADAAAEEATVTVQAADNGSSAPAEPVRNGAAPQDELARLAGLSAPAKPAAPNGSSPQHDPAGRTEEPVTRNERSPLDELAGRAGSAPQSPAPQPTAPETPAAESESAEDSPEQGKSTPPPNPPVQPEPLTRGLFAPIRPAESAQSYPSLRDTPVEQTAPRGPGTPARGFTAPGQGPAPRGFEGQRQGTPPQGGQGPGTPPPGFQAPGVQTPGAQLRDFANQAPGTPPGGFASLTPGTPPRGFQNQAPGTPPRGFAEQTQHLPPRGPEGQGGPQGPGTPPRGQLRPQTPPRGMEQLQARSVDGPTQAIPARAFEQVTRQVEQSTQALPKRGRPVEQPTQSIPRPLGAGRQPDPDADTIQIPKIEAATSYLPAPAREADATVVAALPPTPPGGPTDGFDEGGADERRSRRKRRTIMGVAAAFGVFGLLYGVDLLLTQGNVPRGVAVAGVDVGGLDRAAAETKLRQQIEPRLTKPVTVRAGDVEAGVNPQEAGLTLDWPATLDQAGAQPLNPLTRLTSFFGTRDVGVVTRADGPKLTAALEGLRGKTDRDPVEGTVRFQNAKPVAVDPKSGQKLDVEKASAAMVADWADGKVVELPVSASQVKSSPESVRKAVEEIAKPAVSGPVVVQGEGKNANVPPAAIANALKFEVDEGGNLIPKLDNGKVVDNAKPQLASTEKPGKDATFSFEGGKPVVKESADGRGVDWEKTLAGLPEVLRRTDNRTIKAEYGDQPAKLTTDQANQLGVKELVSRFETKGFAADSGQNIRRAAEQINGAVVKPGETFSLNGRTGPRTAATGYVEAGILEHGLPGRGVGGGVSQMATTIYNAAYYAGMVDVEHKEHSNYISRYPAGREATVFQGPSGQSLIDVKFRNDSKTGIYVQTIWTSNSITVQLWGTKTYDVQAQDGQRSNVTQPNTRHVTDKPDCKPNGGLEGFTITDTRTIKDITTGKSRTERRTVTYKAQDKIVCGPPTP
ncbi:MULTISPECIES: VanW family protein [unclassified Crossiella]|uniref:VanW family protein n=1 Tax=unclassified Crossiella TaxID=2620835 RepID=UPI001FFEFCE5|nr:MULTISPECIES: VanW family protein [unclassified Crossiella]MCK2236422.1 VanW family protein [Crossiella sp. S99.2]MCK2250089.1 VanW family protein [Crossiella sp. S99.1]